MFLKRETVGLAEMEKPFEAFQEASAPAPKPAVVATEPAKELAASK